MLSRALLPIVAFAALAISTPYAHAADGEFPRHALGAKAHYFQTIQNVDEGGETVVESKPHFGAIAFYEYAIIPMRLEVEISTGLVTGKTPIILNDVVMKLLHPVTKRFEPFVALGGGFNIYPGKKSIAGPIALLGFIYFFDDEHGFFGTAQAQYAFMYDVKKFGSSEPIHEPGGSIGIGWRF